MIGGRSVLAVDILAVPNLDDEDNHLIVHYPADDPKIANSVSPKFPEPGALQGPSDAARIFQFCNSLEEKFQDALGMLAVKLVQCAVCRFGKFNLPCHDASTHFPGG